MCKKCDEIKKSKKPKKLSKVQKDLPRYKVTMEYEREFKRNYFRSLSNGLVEVIKIAKKFSE